MQVEYGSWIMHWNKQEKRLDLQHIEFCQQILSSYPIHSSFPTVLQMKVFLEELDNNDCSRQILLYHVHCLQQSSINVLYRKFFPEEEAC